MAIRARISGLVLASIALIVGFWRLNLNGLGNYYYTAADVTGAHSFRSLFFAAFDRAGVMAIDKPPLGLAAPAFAVHLFGVSSWTILGPQVIMFAVGVFVLHDLLRRRVSSGAANIAALVLIVTPIDVAVARSNNPDELLVLLTIVCLALAVESLHRDELRWALAAGLIVGFAFTTKLLQAWVGVPGLVFCLGFLSPGHWRQRMTRVVGFAAVATVSSLAWIQLVDRVTPADRPYVTNSANNTELDLAFGFNGAHRLAPFTTGHTGSTTATMSWVSKRLAALTQGRNIFGGSFVTQSTWTLIAALIGGGLVFASKRGTGQRVTAFFLCWTMSHAVVLIVIPGKFSPYYLAPLIPGVASLLAIAIDSFVPSYTGTHTPFDIVRPRSALLAAVLCGGLVTVWTATHGGPLWILAAASVLAFVAVLSAAIDQAATPSVGAAHTPVEEVAHRRSVRLRLVSIAAAVLALSVGPARWTFAAVSHPEDPANPNASLNGRRSPNQQQRTVDRNDARLTSYALARTNQHQFVLATSRVLVAAQEIVNHHRAVVPLGGFFGTDHFPSLSKFSSWLANGRLRWVAVPDLPPGRTIGSLSPSIVARPWGPYVRANCVLVPPTLFRGIDHIAYWHRYNRKPLHTPLSLYDCGTAAGRR